MPKKIGCHVYVYAYESKSSKIVDNVNSLLSEILVFFSFPFLIVNIFT